ncbi:Oidioi.mRNA.OKI2018_I69.chr1.g2902.t1.cds [Oikopleura dioica]|uniref:Oidioi.mRNA.OKI2018_I69.chr1.g2902.t1.cds n=1 Tax=Oikopleura dioica TaxID=34765 RepID=A0ABN7SW06_OIKDI|nr:Oidioi.mRNA.OKI2018_I69.chr1.g2902.t1.cds [Oikopleura dioica]
MLSKLARPTLARRSLMEFSWQSNYNVATNRGAMRVKNFGWYGQVAMMMIAPFMVYKIPMTTCGQNFQIWRHQKAWKSYGIHRFED